MLRDLNKIPKRKLIEYIENKNNAFGFVLDPNDEISIRKIKNHCFRHRLTLIKIYHDMNRMHIEMQYGMHIIFNHFLHIGKDAQERISNYDHIIDDKYGEIYIRDYKIDTVNFWSPLGFDHSRLVFSSFSALFDFKVFDSEDEEVNYFL